MVRGTAMKKSAKALKYEIPKAESLDNVNQVSVGHCAQGYVAVKKPKPPE
jgi:hypothetical protein